MTLFVRRGLRPNEATTWPLSDEAYPPTPGPGRDAIDWCESLGYEKRTLAIGAGTPGNRSFVVRLLQQERSQALCSLRFQRQCDVAEIGYRKSTVGYLAGPARMSIARLSARDTVVV